MDGKTEQKQIAVLRQGEGFGELSLISNHPRIASILCRENSYFATLARDDYTRILSKIQTALMETKIEILNHQTIFKQLSKATMQRLSYFFKIRRFKRKQQVFGSGEDSAYLYLVKGGEFQLTQEVDMTLTSTKSHSFQKPTKVRVDVTLITVGEFIGSEEVVGRRPYRYTCSCHSTEGELMAISKKDFFHTLGSEEILTYFSALGKVREEYRQERIKTAEKVEREKRTMLMSCTACGRDVSHGVTRSSDLFPSTIHQTKHSSDLSSSSFHSYSFSTRVFSPSKDQCSLKAMLESTSGKRMIIRTQSDRVVTRVSRLGSWRKSYSGARTNKKKKTIGANKVEADIYGGKGRNLLVV